MPGSVEVPDDTRGLRTGSLELTLCITRYSAPIIDPISSSTVRTFRSRPFRRAMNSEIEFNSFIVLI